MCTHTNTHESFVEMNSNLLNMQIIAMKSSVLLYIQCCSNGQRKTTIRLFSECLHV